MPEKLFLHQKLRSPDIELLVRAVRDTFINHVCTTHQIPSLCPCGERLNSEAMELFPKSEFDPLGIEGKT